MPRNALILGVGGQDGYLMADLLLSKGYEVTGLALPENMGAETLMRLAGKVRLVQGSICDRDLMSNVLTSNHFDHIYNFASASFIPYSWEAPSKVAETNGFVVSFILEILRQSAPDTRFFQAGSSEVFGHDPVYSPQDESTPFNPDNPYASAKVFAIHIARNYRLHFNMFTCTGILFNHESHWRPVLFVTRKITRAVAAIKLGLMDRIELGNVLAQRDWSYAGDIVEAVWLMMNAEEPKEYVLSSGKLHTVKDWLEIAFSHVGLKWSDYVTSSKDLHRPLESKPLCGNPALAMKELRWKPKKSFAEMVRMMVDEDMAKLKKGAEPSVASHVLGTRN